MTIPHRRFGFYALAHGLCATLAFVSSAAAQPLSASRVGLDQRQEEIKNLVVVVRSTLREGSDIGAGIVFSVERGRVNILTANHVVRRGPETAERVDVEFRWRPGERVPAQVLNLADATLDVAVLSVATVIPDSLLQFDRLGNPGTVSRGDAVFSIGHPNGRLWEANVQADAISGSDGIRLFFQSTFIAPGHSGGALLNTRWELIGMLRSDQPPRAEAIGIDRIIAWLTANRYNVELRTPGAASTLSALEDRISEDVVYACAALAAFVQNPETKVEALIDRLAAARGTVESDPRVSHVRSVQIAMMYRCLGGAYLIDSRVSRVPDRIRASVPMLRRSLDFDPTQSLLPGNIATLEKFLADGGGDMKLYLTNLYEILEGRATGDGVKAANAIAQHADGSEFQARQWLMQEATTIPLRAFLDALRIMIKQQRNIDVAVEENSRLLANGLVEVTATVGVNSFSWTVDYAKKQYTANDEFTRLFMEKIVLNAKP